MTAETETVTDRKPNQTEPEVLPVPAEDLHARPCTGARARLTQDSVTERVGRMGDKLAQIWLEPEAYRRWQDELGSLRRYKRSSPLPQLQWIAKVWHVLAVPSQASKQASAYLMRRAGRGGTFAGLAVLTWAFWPGPWPIWVPVVIALWLVA